MAISEDNYAGAAAALKLKLKAVKGPKLADRKVIGGFDIATILLVIEICEELAETNTGDLQPLAQDGYPLKYSALVAKVDNATRSQNVSLERDALTHLRRLNGLGWQMEAYEIWLAAKFEERQSAAQQIAETLMRSVAAEVMKIKGGQADTPPPTFVRPGKRKGDFRISDIFRNLVIKDKIERLELR